MVDDVNAHGACLVHVFKDAVFAIAVAVVISNTEVHAHKSSLVAYECDIGVRFVPEVCYSPFLDGAFEMLMEECVVEEFDTITGFGCSIQFRRIIPDDITHIREP